MDLLRMNKLIVKLPKEREENITMKKCFENLFLMFVLALIGCGGDEPLPVPEEPKRQDTIVVDTTETDTVSSDTAEKFVFEYRISQEGMVHCFLSSNTKDTEYTWDGRWGFSNKEHEFYHLKEEAKYVTASCQGYVPQGILLQTPFSRTIDFALQPMPSGGTAIQEINEAIGGLTIANSRENQESNRIAARLTFPDGLKIEGGKNEEKLTLTTFVPAASPIEDMKEGYIMSGAIAGLTVGSSDLMLSKEVNATVTLPYALDGYSLKATTPDGWRIPIAAKENTATFGLPELDEWAIEMEAKVMEITTGREYILQGKSEYFPYYAQYFPIGEGKILKKRGFEADSSLNEIEERFLVSLFGKYNDNPSWASNHETFTIEYNAPCTMVYDVWQDVHHMTFEAGGRQFRARIYGDVHIEVLSITQDKAE